MKTKRPSYRVNFFVSLFTLLLASLVFMSIVEFIYSFKIRSAEGSDWVDVNTQYDPELGWSNASNRHQRNAWGTITHNQRGFRSETFNPERKQVVLLGDSIAWGYGVSDEETIAAQLQKQVPPDTQVSNLGVSGFGVDQSYLWLKRHLGKFKEIEAVILILNAENDLIDVGSNARYGKSKPLFGIQDEQLVLEKEPGGKYSLRNLFSESILVRKLQSLHSKFGAFFDQMAGDIEKPESETREILRAFLLELRSAVEAQGASFYVLNSPSLIDYTEGPIGFSWAEAVLRQENMKTISVFQELSNHFKEIEFAYFDEEHYSPAGSEWIAAQIAKAIGVASPT